MLLRLMMLLGLLAAVPAAAQKTGGTIETAPGIMLRYERIGTGPEVVLVPGRFLFDGALDALARPERTLILYDMRNRGESSYVAQEAQISIEADVADLEAVRRHFGAGKVSLVGWSYLGLMTALYAAEHPDRVARLAQLGPVAIRWDTQFPADLVWRDKVPVVPPEAEAELARLRESGWARANRQEYCLRSELATRATLVGDPANAVRIDAARRCAMPNEWPANFQRHLQIHFEGSVQKLDPPRDKFRALTIPVLTIHGTRDRNAPFAAGAEWASTFPNARFIVSRGAAHALWLDDTQAVRDVDRFLAGEWPDRAVRLGSLEDVRRLLPNGLD